MREHRLFYYPYASFTDDQLPLLKVAALYFDKLVLLDPVGANWENTGLTPVARDAVRMLFEEGILEPVSPAETFAKFDSAIKESIRRDMVDRKFLDLCDEHSRKTGRQRWSLSLAKVPHDLLKDQALRTLLGDFAREVANDSGKYQEQSGGNPTEYYQYAESGRSLDEYREGSDGVVEYRAADFPLALGEAIMINHALFTGLLHSAATPFTDDPFHNRVLALKLQRAMEDPAVQQAQADRAMQTKANLLAAKTLTDSQLELPILSHEMPIDEILEYRREHIDTLSEARTKMAWMARSIEAEPWTEQFEKELYHKTIPSVAEKLEEARKARDAWLKSKRGRLALKASGAAVAAASVILGVIAAPVTPLALVITGLGLTSGVAIPGAEWILDWRDGKQTIKENGLHYLLKV